MDAHHRHQTDPDRLVQVALVVASVRSTRVAGPLLGWVRAGAERQDWLDLDIVDLVESDVHLPAEDMAPGGGGTPLSERLERADAFVVLTPEYNHSFPGPLKNAIDWHHTEWARKPVAFVSYGARSGGIRAVEQLRQVFPELRATTTREAVALAAPWERLDPQTSAYRATPDEDDALDATLVELRWWAEALREARDRARTPA